VSEFGTTYEERAQLAETEVVQLRRLLLKCKLHLSQHSKKTFGAERAELELLWTEINSALAPASNKP
jgi:hypothetical protein